VTESNAYPIEYNVTCPFCGEEWTAVIDTSVDLQNYIEDCYVCCRPISFTVACEEGEVLSIEIKRD